MVIWKARKGIIWLEKIPIIPNRVGILNVVKAEFGAHLHNVLIACNMESINTRR